jgi:hypothetical protein
MRKRNTPKRIHVTKPDMLVIVSVLAITWVVAFGFTDNAGASVIIAFCSALATRDALIAPYKSHLGEKIKTMFVSGLMMGFTGFAIAITYGPPGLGVAGIGGLLGILFVFVLYLISSILASAK